MQECFRVAVAWHGACTLTDDSAAAVGGCDGVCSLMLHSVFRNENVKRSRLAAQANLACDIHGLVEVARTGCSEGGRVDAFVVVAHLDA